MRKRRPPRPLWFIILGLVLFFPLGLLMLWTSSRPLRAKASTTAIALVLVIAALFAVRNSAIYARFVRSPESGYEYDFTMDDRGRYRTPQILKFESEVFGAVVSQLRRMSAIHSRLPPAEESMTEEVSPEALAFDNVADEYGLDPEDVAGIYNKVSIQLARRPK